MKKRNICVIMIAFLLTGCNSYSVSTDETNSVSLEEYTSLSSINETSTEESGIQEIEPIKDTEEQTEYDAHINEIKEYIGEIHFSYSNVDTLRKNYDMFDALKLTGYIEEYSKDAQRCVYKAIREPIEDGDISFEDAKIVLDEIIENYPDINSMNIDDILSRMEGKFEDGEDVPKPYYIALYYSELGMNDHKLKVIVSLASEEAEKKYGGSWQNVTPKSIGDHLKDKKWSYGEISINSVIDAIENDSDIFFMAKNGADENYTDEMRNYYSNIGKARITAGSLAGCVMLHERFQRVAVIDENDVFEFTNEVFYN